MSEARLPRFVLRRPRRGLGCLFLAVAISSVFSAALFPLALSSGHGRDVAATPVSFPAPTPGPGTRVAAGVSAIPAGRLVPEAGGSGPSVSATLVLDNNSLLPGNVQAGLSTDPVAAVFDSGTGQLVVANSVTNNVSFVSGSTELAVGQVAVGRDPIAVAYDSGRGEIFVSNHVSNTVSVIADSNRSLVATIPVRDGPVGVAYDSGRGEVFVASTDSASSTGVVQVISDSTNRVLANVTVGSYPTGVVDDPTDAELFVANSNPGYAVGLLSVVSTVTDSPVATVSVGEDPFGLAYDGATGQVFVANEGSCASFLGIPLGCSGGNVSVVSTASDTVVASIATHASPAGLVYDGNDGLVYASEPGVCFIACTSGHLEALSASLDTVVHTLAGPVGSPSLAFDPTTDRVYSPNQGGGCATFFGIVLGCAGSSVGVIDGANDTPIVSVELSSFPSAVAYDTGTGAVLVTDSSDNALREVSGTTNSTVASVDLGRVASGVAYDSGTGQVFVAEANGFANGTVAVVSDSNHSVLATIPVGRGPQGEAYDSGRGEVFVADNLGDNVSVISDASDTVVATVRVPALPTALAYDPALNEIFVASDGACFFSFCSTVSVISDLNDSIVATIPVGAQPLGLTYDSASSEVFVANEFSDIDAISTLTNTVVASVPVGFGTSAIASDPADGLVFATSTFGNVVFVLGGGNDTLFATVPVGSDPVSVTVDPVDHLAYAANFLGGTLSILSPGTGPYPTYFPVAFAQSGLPAGKNWRVAFDGVGQNITNRTVAIGATNGTHAYLVTGPSGWSVAGSSSLGRVSVVGSPILVALRFVRQPTHPLGFSERGLPLGQSWCVTMGSSECTSGPGLRFANLTGGTYAFTVFAPAGMTVLLRVGDAWVATSSGVVTVGGFAKVFVRFAYPVTFTESGLPSGTPWSVNSQGLTGHSTNGTLVLYLMPGSDRFSVPPVPGFHATPGFGRVIVSIGPASQTIAFSAG